MAPQTALLDREPPIDLAEEIYAAWEQTTLQAREIRRAAAYRNRKFGERSAGAESTKPEWAGRPVHE